LTTTYTLPGDRPLTSAERCVRFGLLVLAGVDVGEALVLADTDTPLCDVIAFDELLTMR
jgi:hypothetical protein